jgi:F-box/leucine-rich repeat protein 10/11
MEADPKRTITVRPPARKSSRQKKPQDYANLHAGVEGGTGSRWMQLMQGKTIEKDSFKRMKGEDVGVEWLESDENALKEPVIIEDPEGLGMKMPPTDFSVADVAEVIGKDTPVEVIGAFIFLLNSASCFIILVSSRCGNAVQ